MRARLREVGNACASSLMWRWQRRGHDKVSPVHGHQGKRQPAEKTAPALRAAISPRPRPKKPGPLDSVRSPRRPPPRRAPAGMRIAQLAAHRAVSVAAASAARLAEAAARAGLRVQRVRKVFTGSSPIPWGLLLALRPEQLLQLRESSEARLDGRRDVMVSAHDASLGRTRDFSSLITRARTRSAAVEALVSMPPVVVTCGWALTRGLCLLPFSLHDGALVRQLAVTSASVKDGGTYWLTLFSLRSSTSTRVRHAACSTRARSATLREPPAMLPEGCHNRFQDWTIFMLNRQSRERDEEGELRKKRWKGTPTATKGRKIPAGPW